jgi:hypothetical protein
MLVKRGRNPYSYGKSGNKYLAWAHVETANHEVRYSPELLAWFQRKQKHSGKRVIALKALANKLAKACFFACLYMQRVRSHVLRLLRRGVIRTVPDAQQRSD